MEVTGTLARFVVDAKAEKIPPPVIHEATRSILNWVGCAVGGCRHEAVDRAMAAFRPFAGPAQASVLGRRERTDILNAALLNGISSHVLDFDDTHLRTVIHPAGPVASAVLALAEYIPCTGREFLLAFILGVEVECRIGNSVTPAHYDAGWHITGTAGIFGAAAAAGKLLGLDDRQMAWALGTAGTQSSGIREMLGTMCKGFHVGHAAQCGLASALLAQSNFTSSTTVLEGRRGFAAVMSTARNLSEITDGLGEHYEVSLNTYKPFACGIVAHPAIDGGIQLRNEHGLKGDEIQSVHLKVAPYVLELMGKRTPQLGLEGKFSVFHSVAVAIRYGAAGPSEYTDDCVKEPGVIALRDRIEAEADPALRTDEAYVRIKLKNGKELEKHVEHAVGSLERPMSDKDLDAKFRGLAAGILTQEESDRLLDQCWKIESLGDVSLLAKATTPGHPFAATTR
ncbi:MAG TPA: MmgE/PrpD family protein [Candidatus Dormibacteraeota bacterium]|nr:MmgE/PrpD family protein [Candidatus Dormibacteraeota bacterium]